MAAQEVLDPPMGEIAEYNPIAAGLAALRQRYADLSFDLTTTAGNTAARQARKELVTLRTTLEERRKELKAPILERARLLDAEAKRITGEILALEEPIDQQIKVDEKRRADEKAAREKAERERVEALQTRLQAIIATPAKWVAASSAEIAEAHNDLQRMEIGDDWQEFRERAESARQEAVASLKQLHAAATQREDEAAAQAAERARLERERQQAEEQRRAQEAETARWRAEAEAAQAEAKRAREEAEQAEAKRAEQARPVEVEPAAQIPTIQPEQIVKVVDQQAPAPMKSSIFGVVIVEPTIEQAAQIAQLVATVPAAVLAALEKSLNARGFALRISVPDDGK